MLPVTECGPAELQVELHRDTMASIGLWDHKASDGRSHGRVTAAPVGVTARTFSWCCEAVTVRFGSLAGITDMIMNHRAVPAVRAVS